MNKCVLYAFAAAAILGSTQATVCRADTLTIGTISFDSGVSASGYTFDLSNFTGLNSFPPDDIADSELFSGTLTVTTDDPNNPTTPYSFSNIDENGTTIITIPLGENVLSAVLTLTLSKTQNVSVYGDTGTTAVVANLAPVPLITLSLIGGATSLTPCDGSFSYACSTANITVDTLPTSTGVTPEPETMWLVLTGIGGAAAFRRRLHLR